MHYVGIDYHKRYSVVCILDAEGETVRTERIEHVFPEDFGQLLAHYTPFQIGFEATLNWGWLYDLLEEIPGVERIVMANPLHVRLISAAQVKTDKVDVRVKVHPQFHTPASVPTGGCRRSRSPARPVDRMGVFRVRGDFPGILRT